MFQGEITHSHNYRVPDVYKDKTVVCLGAAASGQDLSLDVATVAKKVNYKYMYNKTTNNYKYIYNKTTNTCTTKLQIHVQQNYKYLYSKTTNNYKYMYNKTTNTCTTKLQITTNTCTAKLQIHVHHNFKYMYNQTTNTCPT